MRGLVLVAGVVLALSSVVAAEAGEAGAAAGFPDPVDTLGVRLEIRTISATINAQHPDHGAGTTRSVAVNGSVTPLAGIEGTQPAPREDGEHPGTTAVLSAEIVSFIGDDREVEFESQQQLYPWTVAKLRQRLSQVLLNNPHMLLQPPPQLSAQQLQPLQLKAGGFSAHAKIDLLPATIDRLVVALDLVRATRVDVISLPLEAMDEHKEIVPGVRLLVRSVEDVESSGRTYTRVGLEYFIDRDRDDDAPDVFEATPLVPAIAIRDANGHVVHMVQRAQETETRDEFIVSISDLNIGLAPQVKRPLTVDVVVLHGLERHEVELVVEDVGLAGE